MFHKFISDKSSYLPLSLRLGLGLVLVPEGFSMVMNYYDSLEWLTGALRLPLFVAYAFIIIEFYASLFLIFGLASRWMAGAIGAMVLTAIPFHFTSSLQADWLGLTIGQGIEFHILLVATAVALMITGSGKWSLDWAISHFRF